MDVEKGEGRAAVEVRISSQFFDKTTDIEKGDGRAVVSIKISEVVG